MIEVVILFTVLFSVESARKPNGILNHFWQWIKWRAERPAPNFTDPDWGRKLENWRIRKP